MAAIAALSCGRIGFEESPHDSGIPVDAPTIDATPPTPLFVAQGGHPYRITANGDSVFWSDFETGGVYAFPVLGGAARTIVAPTPGTTLYGMALVGDALYTCDRASGELRQVAISDGASTRLATSPCFDVAADETHLYWTSTEPLEPNVRRISLTGGAIEDIGEAGVSGNLKLVDDTLFWTSYGGGEVRQMPTSGGPSQLLATALTNGPWGLFVEGGFVYWVDHQLKDGELRRVPIGGGAAESLVVGLGGPHQLVVENEEVYWTNEYDGTIMHRSVDGIVSVLVDEQSNPMGVVLTQDTMFWTNEGGTVMRLAR